MKSLSLSTFLNSTHPSRISSNSILFCDVSHGTLSLLQFFFKGSSITRALHSFYHWAHTAWKIWTLCLWGQVSRERAQRPARARGYIGQRNHTTPDFTVHANLGTFFSLPSSLKRKVYQVWSELHLHWAGTLHYHVTMPVVRRSRSKIPENWWERDTHRIA